MALLQDQMETLAEVVWERERDDVPSEIILTNTHPIRKWVQNRRYHPLLEESSSAAGL